MLSLKVILMILAFFSLVLAAINVVSPRINLLALGLALWLLAILISG